MDNFNEICQKIRRGKTLSECELYLKIPHTFDLPYSNFEMKINLILFIIYYENVDLLDKLLSNYSSYHKKTLSEALNFVAIDKKKIDAVKILLRYGADINYQDKDGYTALMYASEYSNTFSSIEIVRLLLENGANVNLQEKEAGKTALMLSAKSFPFNSIYECEDYEDSGDEINNSNIQTMKLLIEYGSNLSLKNKITDKTIIDTIYYWQKYYIETRDICEFIILDTVVSDVNEVIAYLFQR